MTDWSDIETRPDPDFEARLERTLLGQLFGDARADPADGATRRAARDPGVDRSTEPHRDELVQLDRHPPDAHRGPRWLGVAAALLLVAGLSAVVVTVVTRVDISPAPPLAVPPRTVTFDAQWPPLGGLESKECITTSVTYESAVDGRCWRTFSGEATLTGDLEGTALWAMDANLGTPGDANDSTVEIPAVFNGTYLVRAAIPGCGTGEFMIAESLRFVGWASGQFIGTWQIMPASGRGDLTSISGSGTLAPATTDDPDAIRVHTGTITCG